MPELPEVERAASLMRGIAQGRIIQSVQTEEDNIVYSGVTHEQFAKSTTGRRVISVGRYGKVIYVSLDGDGPSPVLHLGMTGMIHIKGQKPILYARNSDNESQIWPPRFMKFILHFSATPSSPEDQIAFADARRLGRIRLCASPLTEPPISKLGFDPLLSMPPLEEFSSSVCKRHCTIKALLLDQSFSAGVGNWVADEVLYQSRVHPERHANSLTDTELALLHHNIVAICQKAVDVDADSSRFPDNWLFKHRWGKGKKVKHTLLLPSGEPATIKWITVGGRTAAYVTELQKLSKKDIANISEEAVLSDGEGVSPQEQVTATAPTRKARKRTNDPLNERSLKRSKRGSS